MNAVSAILLFGVGLPFATAFLFGLWIWWLERADK